MGRDYNKEDLNKYKFYEYKLPGEWKVLAGKTNIDNDYLSIKLSNANDYWFHIKGMPGSHVVLRVESEKPDKDTINKAASIAAYHSKARNGGMVAVSCTLAQYVTKPRGAKPGTVSIRKESTLKVKPWVPE